MKNTGILYMDIAESIKKAIQHNHYPVGELLPTETEFEEMYKVSKITIRKAVELLANQGFVEKKSGKGTTVISNRLFNKVSKGESFSTILEKKGRTITKEITDITCVSLREVDELFEWFGPKATCVSRMYRLDDEPYILFEHYLPGDMYSEIATKINEVSLYQLLANHGYQINHFNDQFSVVELDESEQRRLKTSKIHGLKRVRRSFDAENRIIEISFAKYQTDKYPYEIEFEV